MFKIKDIKFDSGTFIETAFLNIVEKDNKYFLVDHEGKQIGTEKFTYIDSKTYDWQTNTFVASDGNSNMFHINTEGKRLYKETYCYAGTFGEFDNEHPELAYVVTNEKESKSFLINVKGKIEYKAILKGGDREEFKLLKPNEKEKDFIQELEDYFNESNWNRISGFYQYKNDYFDYLENVLDIKIEESKKQDIGKVMEKLIDLHKQSGKREIADEEAGWDL